MSEPEDLPDFYGILGIKITATFDEITRAHHRAIDELHTGRIRNVGDLIRRVRELDQAVETLLDDDKRDEYNIKKGFPGRTAVDLGGGILFTPAPQSSFSSSQTQCDNCRQLQTQIEKSQHELKTAQRKIRQISLNLHDVEEINRQTTRERNNLAESLRTANARVEDLEASNERSARKIDNLEPAQEQEESLRERIVELEQERDNIAKEMDDQKASLVATEKELRSLRNRLAGLEEERDRALEQLADKKALEEEAGDQIRDLHREISQLKAQLVDCREEVKSLRDSAPDENDGATNSAGQSEGEKPQDSSNTDATNAKYSNSPGNDTSEPTGESIEKSADISSTDNSNMDVPHSDDQGAEEAGPVQRTSSGTPGDASKYKGKGKGKQRAVELEDAERPEGPATQNRSLRKPKNTSERKAAGQTGNASGDSSKPQRPGDKPDGSLSSDPAKPKKDSESDQASSDQDNSKQPQGVPNKAIQGSLGVPAHNPSDTGDKPDGAESKPVNSDQAEDTPGSGAQDQPGKPSEGQGKAAKPGDEAADDPARKPPQDNEEPKHPQNELEGPVDEDDWQDCNVPAHSGFFAKLREKILEVKKLTEQLAEADDLRSAINEMLEANDIEDQVTDWDDAARQLRALWRKTEENLRGLAEELEKRREENKELEESLAAAQRDLATLRNNSIITKKKTPEYNALKAEIEQLRARMDENNTAAQDMYAQLTARIARRDQTIREWNEKWIQREARFADHIDGLKDAHKHHIKMLQEEYEKNGYGRIHPGHSHGHADEAPEFTLLDLLIMNHFPSRELTDDEIDSLDRDRRQRWAEFYKAHHERDDKHAALMYKKRWENLPQRDIWEQAEKWVFNEMQKMQLEYFLKKECLIERARPFEILANRVEVVGEIEDEEGDSDDDGEDGDGGEDGGNDDGGEGPGTDDNPGTPEEEL